MNNTIAGSILLSVAKLHAELAETVARGNNSEKSIIGIIQKSAVYPIMIREKTRVDLKSQMDKMAEAFSKLDMNVDRGSNFVNVKKERLQVSFTFDSAGFLDNIEFWAIEGDDG